jgi:acetoin utilization deacetylase AcuC-like enzyme
MFCVGHRAITPRLTWVVDFACLTTLWLSSWTPSHPRILSHNYLYIQITAKYALQHYPSIGKIAILDWDVHHGNGTEKAFYDRRDVLFISIHQDSLYPLDSGSNESRGANDGEYFNINVAVPPGSGIGMYDAAMARLVLPALHAFQPDLLLVSSGFDACALDPLSHIMLNSSAYFRLTSALVAFCGANQCKGPVLMHEGGYSEVYAPFCALRVIEALNNITPNESAVIDRKR